ncbi:MAG: TIGR01212 family radical SAM protein [Tissierellia bacterium]|jgi:radical SAM protein (TIGR01212 family)|nr:TIGR01212 family radical SAM protein [Tissierellia bacterium]
MRGLAQELKAHFGMRLVKLPLDGGFSCPHLDSGGCLFCSPRGSGEFTLGASIKEQMAYQKKRLAHKGSKYIAYFQNFSGTFAPVEYLEKLYEEVLEDEEVLALAIATRVDCLPTEVLDLLEKISKKTYLWLELGLQTSNPLIMEKMNLNYDVSQYTKAMDELRKRNINVVSHMIIGLPGATLEDELQCARVILEEKSWGVKIHCLYVQRFTGLAGLYEEGNYKPLSFEDYIERASEVILFFGEDIVFHRITGDPPREELLAPHWLLDKRRVLGTLQKEVTRKRKKKIYLR